MCEEKEEPPDWGRNDKRSIYWRTKYGCQNRLSGTKDGSKMQVEEEKVNQTAKEGDVKITPNSNPRVSLKERAQAQRAEEGGGEPSKIP